MTWNEQIKKARQAAEFTQKHFAAKIGITWQSYQRIEAGRQFPRLTLFQAIMKELGMKEITITSP